MKLFAVIVSLLLPWSVSAKEIKMVSSAWWQRGLAQPGTGRYSGAPKHQDQENMGQDLFGSSQRNTK